VTDLAQLVLDEIAADPAALERLRKLVGAGNDAELWIGVQQAAEHIACKPQRIYDLVSQRAIPHRKDGSRLLFRRNELDDWLRH
jgi:excisionase family DNA binding protein